MNRRQDSTAFCEDAPHLSCRHAHLALHSERQRSLQLKRRESPGLTGGHTGVAFAALALVLAIGAASAGAGAVKARPRSQVPDPASLASACRPASESIHGRHNPYLAGVCFPDQVTGPVPSVGYPQVVVFRDTPDDYPQGVAARYDEIGSVYGLAFDPFENVIYAAAYLRRGAYYGSGGPGAIYRIELSGRRISRVIDVAGVGLDPHTSLMWCTAASLPQGARITSLATSVR